MDRVDIQRRRLEYQNRRRGYTVVRSSSGVAAGAALVLILHGTLQNGEAVRTRTSAKSFDELAATGRAVIAYPDAVRREWNGARKAVMFWRGAKDIDDVGFLRALVAELVGEFGLDQQRVYVAGFSLGGQMTMRLLHDAPELMAGAAIIGACLPAPDNRTCHGDAPAAVPVLLIHGTADPVASYTGGPMTGPLGLFPKGEHLSAEATAAYFATGNGITDEPEVEWVHGAPASIGSVRRTEYRQAGRPPVRLYSVIGGGHQIPGAPAVTPRLLGPSPSPLSAAAAVGEFFGVPDSES